MHEKDKTDFEHFMAARWHPLVRAAYVLTGNRQDAEDIAQTALTNAYSVWPRIRNSDDVTVYVHKILINVYRTSRRRRRVREVLTSAVPERRSAAAAAANESLHDRDEVAQALAQLTPRQRAVIVLRYLEDLTEAQTAAALGCSVGTVKSQSSKALARLRAGRVEMPEASGRGIRPGSATEGAEPVEPPKNGERIDVLEHREQVAQ
ncbi:RNA polymerase sigma-70 factor (sigma-E family) [Catenulispora sp. GP43]|uniref:SigE family RNA polymerase sigma factor n=1 Tax=Catenulispora sp. GP43 TaxID=3156263 RepID=UPI00351683E2